MKLARTLVAAAFCLAACAGGQGQPQNGKSGAKRVSAAPGLVVERACSPSGPESCFNARDDNCNGIIDEGCGVHTGLVQFAIAWTQPAADVDINVTDPNGELIEVGRPAESGLVKERDCPGRNNACRGQNLENVYLEEGDPLRGVYRVRIRLEKLGDENPPIVVTLGARVGPKSYAVEITLDHVEDEREVVFEL